MDTVASLRTTEGLLYDLVDHPEEVERLIWEVHRTWWEYYDALDAVIGPGCPGRRPWAPTWAPGRTYMLQCDFSYMIGPEMFERFVLPELTASCRRLEYAFYHLDGVGQLAHLDMLLGIPELHGIQWIPGDGKPGPEEWVEKKGIHPKLALSQLPNLPFVSPPGASTGMGLFW